MGMPCGVIVEIGGDDGLPLRRHGAVRRYEVCSARSTSRTLRSFPVGDRFTMGPELGEPCGGDDRGPVCDSDALQHVAADRAGSWRQFTHRRGVEVKAMAPGTSWTTLTRIPNPWLVADLIPRWPSCTINRAKSDRGLDACRTDGDSPYIRPPFQTRRSECGFGMLRGTEPRIGFRQRHQRTRGLHTRPEDQYKIASAAFTEVRRSDVSRDRAPDDASSSGA